MSLILQKTIDYLKMDIEYSEWESLETIIKDGSLEKVKQLGIEIHKELGKKTLITDKQQYYRFYNILKGNYLI